jgi:hypothetical protein
MTAETPQRGDVAADGRRDNDITLQQIWRALQQGRWLVGFAIALGTGGGWISGQALGPTNRRITRVDNKVMLVDSLSRIEHLQLRATDASLSDRIDAIADQTKLSSYLICTFTRRNDPAAVPPECNQVILDWRRGIR